MVVKIHSEEEVKKDFTVREETSDSGDVSSGWDIFEWASGFGFGALEVVARREELSRLHRPRGWRKITLEPGLILGEVNRILQAHKKKGGHAVQYKMGPDPSSIELVYGWRVV